MKIAKILTTVLISSMLLSVLCCGCTKTTVTTKKPKDDDDTKVVKKLPEDEILIICDYGNGAWGYQSSITYVLSDGSIYSSREGFEGFPDSAGHSLSSDDRLTLLKKYTLPVATLPQDDLLKIYNNIINIDSDARFVYSDEYACDAGTSTTKVNVEGKWVEIEESGDRNGELNDRYARKANKLIDDAFASVRETRKDPAHVYSATETFIGTFECTKTTSKDTRRIITNMEELKAFEKDTGIDLSSNEYFEDFGGSGYDAFNWCCIAIEIVVYPHYLSLDDVSADAFIVADNYVGFGYITAPVIDVSDDVVEQKCYCHVVQVPSDHPEDYDRFLKEN
ncbi:MAG: hypothetical protein IKF09_02520 [Clostridiales bacterium]|nr:hypothetical protein [Clostridiales bacterium]